MKLNPVILIIVVALAIYIGLNLNNDNTIANKSIFKDDQVSSNVYVEKVTDKNIDKTEPTKEDQQKEFMNFYNNINKLVHNFEEIDKTTASIAKQNPPRTQQYEFFLKAKKTMEKGQKLPLTTLIPKGFNESQTKVMTDTVRELDNAFQYRKFGYEHYLEYLETGSPKTYNTSKEWMNSANYSLQSVVINLEALKVEIGYDDKESK